MTVVLGAIVIACIIGVAAEYRPIIRQLRKRKR